MTEQNGERWRALLSVLFLVTPYFSLCLGFFIVFDYLVSTEVRFME
jgi:hypothetical protein